MLHLVLGAGSLVSNGTINVYIYGIFSELYINIQRPLLAFQFGLLSDFIRCILLKYHWT